VLHVEDDEAILQLLHILVGDAAGLTQVSSVAAAREALATTQYDIVLLDVLLPDGGGLELLETIVSLQPKATEVLALTQVDLTPAQQQRFTRVFAKDAALVAQLSHYLNARMERGGSAR
jgi:DNA-binding response OmpR family regulator